MFRWGLFLLLAAALIGGGYLYFHLDNEIRRQVEGRLASHYRHLKVNVGSAQFVKERGISIRNVSLTDPQSGFSQPILTIDEIFLAGSFRVDELLSESLPIEQIVLRKPRLNMIRQPNGGWNASTLLPPPKFSEQAPPMMIEDAELTLQNASPSSARPLEFRGIGVTLTPTALNAGSPAIRLYHVEGTATGPAASQLRLDGEINTQDGACEVTIAAQGMEVSQELVSSLPVQVPDSLKKFDLRGPVDAALHVKRDAGAKGQVAWSTRVKMERGRLQHSDWPQPLTDLAFVLQADGSRLQVEQLSGKWGSSTIVFKCTRNGWSANAPLGLAARVNGLMIDGQLLPLLPERFGQCWKRFDPAGLIDLEVGVNFDGQEWRPKITAICRGVALTDTEKFPYRIEQAVGRIEYVLPSRGGVDQLRIDLTGVGAGRPVQINAELTNLAVRRPSSKSGPSGVAAIDDLPDQHAPETLHAASYRAAGPSPTNSPSDHHAVGWVQVKGTKIPLPEPALLHAISHHSQRGARLVQSLNAQGAVDFIWRAEWKDETQLRADTSFDLILHDCVILFDGFQYPLRRVSGLVTQRNRQWQIHDVQGQGGSDGTVVVCSGHSIPAGDGYQTNLVFRAGDVPLDNGLRQALPAGPQRAWDELRPQGRVDFTAYVLHESGQPKPAVDIELRPRDMTVSIEPRQFAYRFDGIRGVARYSAGRVEVQDFLATHGRTTWSGRRGVWQAAANGGWQFLLSGVNADRLDTGRDFVAALPAGMQKVIERLQPSGSFALHDSTLSFFKDSESAPLTTAWDLKLQCHQASLGGGFPLTNISGEVRLSRVNPQAAFTTGELDIDTVSFKGTQLTSLRGPIWADSSWCLFGQPAHAKMGHPQPQPITADAYGGSVTADLRMNHTPNSNYRLELAMGGVDLSRFATERMGGPEDLTGTVSGKLVLEGAGPSTATLLGGGELYVVDANIYQLPVVVALLKVLRNRTPDTTAFNRCDMRFQVVGENIVFNRLNLLGDAVSLYGRGETNFDRKLNLLFYSLMGPADLPIPFYKTILGHASQQMLQVKVAGTWDEPQSELKALPAVNDALQFIQGELEAGAATVTSPSAMRDALAPRR